MNCCLAEAQKLQKSTAKQKQGGGQDTGERQRQKGGGQKGGGKKGGFSGCLMLIVTTCSLRQRLIMHSMC